MRSGSAFFSARNFSAALCIGVLAACASPLPLDAELDPATDNDLASAGMPATHLQEPGANEVVVVVNNNGGIGNHAGFFVGRRLSDPAGSYRFVRAKVAGWKKPTLNDYVGFQMVDGPRVASYRFTLHEGDLAAVAARMPAADAAAPLFCASAANNAIAGIGPFASIEPVHWMTPAALAGKLDAIVAASPELGACVLPDGSSCAQPLALRAAASP